MFPSDVRITELHPSADYKMGIVREKHIREKVVQL